MHFRFNQHLKNIYNVKVAVESIHVLFISFMQVSCDVGIGNPVTGLWLFQIRTIFIINRFIASPIEMQTFSCHHHI